MRFDVFRGMVPKTAPPHLPEGAAQFAENCYFTDGSQLVPERSALLLPKRILAVDGSVLATEPVTLWRSGDTYIGWDHHVEVCSDYREYPTKDSFLFVDEGKLYRCCDLWVLDGTGPRAVGVPRPEMPPVLTVLNDTATVWSATDNRIPQTAVDFPDFCKQGAQPGEARSYVFTWVNDMGEEGPPSDPCEPQRIPIEGSALVTSGIDAPANIVGWRWYRTLSDGQGQTTFRFVRETTAPVLSDQWDALRLGDEIEVVGNYPPPDGIMGVARVGTNRTLLWDRFNNVWPSAPRQPSAYPQEGRQTVQATILRSVSRIRFFEGQTNYFQIGSGYEVSLLTDGHPYSIVAQGPEKEAITIHQHSVWEPCVSPRAVTTGEGTCYYASPRGIVALEYGQTASVLDDLFTQEQWTTLQPHKMHLAYQRGRLFSFGGGYNWYLPISRYIRDRQPMLSATRYAPTATHAEAETLTLALSKGDLLAWDEGPTFQEAVWHSGEMQEKEFWNPGAVQVDAAVGFTWSAQADAAWNAYTNWRNLSGACAKDDAFFTAHPQYASERAYVEYMKSPIVVEVWREGKIFAIKKVIPRRPTRLPRQGRALYWSIRIRTRIPIWRVQIEAAIKDMASPTEAQRRTYHA